MLKIKGSKLNIPLILIVFLAGLLRFFWLDKIPIAITGDELDYIINAKAIFLRFTDISGTWFPLSFTKPPFSYPKGEILYFFLAPLIGPFPLSLFFARLPSALLSTLFVVLIYFIVKKLIGKPQAMIAALVMAINPFSIFFGRTAYDTPITIFFYFLAFYLVLVLKKWKILLSVPIFAFAFFSYIGTKIIFIPFVMTTLFYAWHYINKKKFGKQYLILVSICLAMFIFYLFNLIQLPSSRAEDLITPNSEIISQTVNLERKLSTSESMRSVFSNKYIVFTRESFITYLGAFSIDLLFLRGEHTAFITLWDQGFFYYLDLVFIPIGCYYLFTRKRSTFFLLSALIFIAPIPSAVSRVGLSYAIRSSLMMPVLIILISCGIWFAVKQIHKREFKALFIIFLSIIYFFLTVNFLNNYFFRNPIYDSESYRLSGRIISKYIELSKKSGNRVVIFTSATNYLLGNSDVFLSYLFYSDMYTSKSFDKIAALFKSKSNTYENIHLASCDYVPNLKSEIIIKPVDTCDKEFKTKTNLSIARLSDGGEIFGVFDKSICSKYELDKYPQGIKIKNFNIEKLSERDFCQTFITDLNL